MMDSWLKIPKSLGIAVILLVLISTSAEAQYRRYDYKYRKNLLFQVFGPEFVGVHANMYMTNQISVNAGFGANLDGHIGGNYYFTDRSLSQGAFYAGGQITTIRQVRLDKLKPERQIGFYLPVGYEFITKKRLTLAADIGYNHIKKRWNQNNAGWMLVSFKIGITTL